MRRVDIMPQINFTEEENKALVELLESSLTDLSYEISSTDKVEFRNQLKSKREILDKILKDLKKFES